MSFLWIPDLRENLVTRDPINNFLSDLCIALHCCLNYHLVEIFEALNSLLQELRLKAFLDELEFKDFHLLSGLLGGHQALLNHVSGDYGLVNTAIVNVTDLLIFSSQKAIFDSSTETSAIFRDKIFMPKL